MNQKEKYVGPFITMVFLFLVIGFLTTANTQFQAPLKEIFLKGAGHYQNTFATLITFSWFLAYPVFGPVGSRFVDRHGYKGTLVRGIAMMVCGLVLFAASAWLAVNIPDKAVGFVPVGFLVFLLGSFVLGGASTVLQVVINPYLSACDVPGTQAVQRMAIGGTANSIGTTLAPYCVSGIALGVAPFMTLAIVMFIVLAVVARLRLPDIENTHTEKEEKLEGSVWQFRHLRLGVIALFFYVGVEVCIGANINMYAIDKGLPSPALLATIYWGGMLVGRLVGSTLRKIEPQTQLLFTTIGASLLLILAIATDNPWILAFAGLFHSIMWGCIFTLATTGLGKYTSAASGVLMIGVFGGAVFPLCQGFIADALGGWRMTWLLVLLGELFMMYYALSGHKTTNAGSVR